jgi:endonuclease/exonuclease/phosphatase family metal-dependent hydrolase
MKLDLGNGKTLGVMNVHTGYSTAYKASDLHLEHFKEISVSMHKHQGKSDYLVVGGDFNAGPDMKYLDQHYDSAKAIWFNGLMPYMKEQQMKLVEGLSKKTWDQKNSLVNNPPFVIQFSYFFWNLTFTWDQIDSTIDHIFVSKNLNVKESSIVFDQKIKASCYGREDENGMLHLSDHYGVNAILDI